VTAPEQWTVLVNFEEQYGLYPVGKKVPEGWRTADPNFTGTEDECQAYVDEAWTDMRPASLRRTMAAAAEAGDRA
jgi:MbtH protein